MRSLTAVRGLIYTHERSAGVSCGWFPSARANQINVPTLTIHKPETALDEARVNAVANGRARADLYARALGRRVVRLVSVSEGGGNYYPPPPMPMAERAMAAQAADPKIVAGGQKLQVTVSMVFELQ